MNKEEYLDGQVRCPMCSRVFFAHYKAGETKKRVPVHSDCYGYKLEADIEPLTDPEAIEESTMQHNYAKHFERKN